ncbi:MAG: transcriptional regulator [Methanomassiliicoccales archaeon]|nr:MAG: transcriptional regulator [Methanomassiliicoccales archaeon]
MTRKEVLTEVRDVLSHLGFFVSEPHTIRSISFDIVARRDEALLIIKILGNVDAFSKENAKELQTLANLLCGSPFIIGMKSSTSDIEDGVVYFRHGIPIISQGTFNDFFVEEVPPFVFAAPGGMYVHIDGVQLRKIREKNRLSLGALAEIAKVSRRSIQLYESGMGAMMEAALRIEEHLKEPIILPINPLMCHAKTEEETAQWVDSFEGFEGLEKDVFHRLNVLGYRIIPTNKSPFDALTKDTKTLILTSVERYDGTLAKRAKVVTNISKVVEKHSVIFVKKSKKLSIEGTPLIDTNELKNIDDSEGVIELILERKGK